MSYDVTDFQHDVLEASREAPVLVDFWAGWCGPCRALGPVLERLAAEPGVAWKLAKLNTEEFPEIASSWDVSSIPNVKLFVNGEVVDEFVGALPESRIRAWLDSALPSPADPTVDSAREALEQRAWSTAAAALRDVVERQPAHALARFSLAEALLHISPAEVPAVAAPLAGDERFGHRAEAIASLAALAARDVFPETPAGAALARAAHAVRAADWDLAFTACIAAMGERRDPSAAEAREAGRALFVMLGPGHPASERHHRALAGARNV